MREPPGGPVHGGAADRRPRRHGRARVSAPPSFLEPIIALAERMDRARLRVRPIRQGGLLGLQLTRHSGIPLTLADGTFVAPGDPVGRLHFDNRAVRALADGSWAGIDVGRADLAELAAWARRQPTGRQPVAYYGASIMWSIARRGGFEVRDRAPTFRARLEDWYLRGVLAHWSRLGQARLARGHGQLRTRDCWISAGSLQRRYGARRG